jgi:hypothetical protein
MRQRIASLLLIAAMVYTGVYVFIYLARAFDVEGAGPSQLVGLHHGDNFSRTLLVAIFFLMGEVLLVYMALARTRRRESLSVRKDLWEWLRGREELTGEPADDIAERAIALYRTRLEGSPKTPKAEA